MVRVPPSMRARPRPLLASPEMTLRARLVRSCPALLLALVVAACSSAQGGRSIGVTSGFNVVSYDVAEREPLPRFDSERLDAPGRLDNTVLAGKVGVINFWGTWCGFCRREQPLLEALSKEYASRGVQFLGVDTRRDQRAAALAYLEEFKVTYPQAFDPASRMAFRFRVFTMPATLIVDRNGKVAAHFIGALFNEADLRKVLDAELSR